MIASSVLLCKLFVIRDIIYCIKILYFNMDTKLENFHFTKKLEHINMLVGCIYKNIILSTNIMLALKMSLLMLRVELMPFYIQYKLR